MDVSQHSGVEANSEQNLLKKTPSLPTVVSKATFFLESWAAVRLNGFVVAVLSRERVQCQTLPSGDLTVAGLATYRFCLHGMALLTNLLTSFEFCSKVYSFNIPWSFISTLTFWLTAWLAVFHRVKTSSFSLLHLLLAEEENFSVRAWAIAGLPDHIWSDKHLISHLEYSSGAGHCRPVPMKTAPWLIAYRPSVGTFSFLM